MKKIPTIFKRSETNRNLVVDEWTQECLWVFKGEGVATRKWDGSCCLIQGGKLWKRYDAKHGKPAPAGFVPAQEPDPMTGHWPGWVPVGDGPADQWHREAFAAAEFSYGPIPDGTYELCGQKINGNPEGLKFHALIPHGKALCSVLEISFDGIRRYLSSGRIEGVVWHHPDGRMAKIKAKDFGIPRMKL